ncbi:hypothetical protein ACOME3_003191 [Neoechinorhynchus agilis]
MITRSQAEQEAISEQLALSISGNPVFVKQATDALKEAELLPDYGIHLLKVIAEKSDNVGLAAAICLKNYVNRSWQGIREDDVTGVIGSDQKESIRKALIKLLDQVSSPSQNQLIVCLSLIASADFPIEWPNMIQELSEQITNDPVAVFSILDNVFRKYRSAERCEEVWSEIRLVIDTFAPKFLEMYQKCIEQLSATGQGADVKLLNFVTLCMDILQSLVSQDLFRFLQMLCLFGSFLDGRGIAALDRRADSLQQEAAGSHIAKILFIIDNLDTYSKGFLVVLGLNPNSNLDNIDEIEEALIATCNCAGLLVRNYQEFIQYARACIDAVWKALSNATVILNEFMSSIHEQMICAALKFLTDVAAYDTFAAAMSEEGALRNICENVIIPCIVPRDEDLLDENVEDLIKKEFEMSSATDTDSIRGCAARLIDAFCHKMEAQVIGVFGQYVEALLTEYNQSSVNWKQKDVATFLVICIARRGQTAKHGVVRASTSIDIPRFFTESLKTHLVTECSVDPNPILKMDAMKYLAEFRYILGKPLLLESMPYLIRLISPNVSSVSVSYALSAAACHTLERLLAMTSSPLETTEKVLFTVDEISPFLSDLVVALICASERKPDKG